MKIASNGPCLLASLALLACSTAHANEQAPEAQSEWKVSIGPGVMVAPKYPGSNKLEVLPLPALDISYDDRFFSQGLDVLGVNVLRDENYHVGAAVSFDFQSRNEADDPRLRGLGNVHWGPKLKIFADYSVSMFTASAALYQDIAGTGQGLLASGDLAINIPYPKGWIFSFGPGVTWANATYMRTLFGVSPQQSAASGLPAHQTSSGVRDVHLNAYASYDFSKHWTGSLQVTAGRLQGSAANSPITLRKTEFNGFAALSYRF
ncbi:structural protein MipA [Caballeronia hypogeia]|uniref:Structural protein MipA n=1 Tax=Caballeronia hypogeia TaxID=1777140 RepID=A0A157ZB06_9BURK|nr:MipA/OmpV family protein [Caballeronia hypogeia]SAK42720.1 structural protein MipA [Caballeronia hypogeia]